jgi:hypothetical protein
MHLHFCSQLVTLHITSHEAEASHSVPTFLSYGFLLTRKNSTHFPAVFSYTGGTHWHSWSRHYATSRKITGWNPDEVIAFFNWRNPSSRTMALGSTQPLTEMSTRNLFWGIGRPARKADNLTAICQPILLKMWEPRCLTTLWASAVCWTDSFTFIMH